MVKKLISFSNRAEGLLTGYVEKKADKAAVTQSRIVEDALLLYIINDSLAEESERIAALSIWNERNRATYYTFKTEEES